MRPQPAGRDREHMTRIADIAWTLLKFIGRGFARSGSAFGPPTPFHMFGLPLPLGSWHRARTGDQR
jgi:hypothetical protein